MEEAKKMRPREYIKIRGANEHNLKNINVDIPRNELVVLTGMSGSGKSSLAFDTIYAENRADHAVGAEEDDRVGHDFVLFRIDRYDEIGRASCRERV